MQAYGLHYAHALDMKAGLKETCIRIYGSIERRASKLRVLWLPERTNGGEMLGTSIAGGRMVEALRVAAACSQGRRESRNNLSGVHCEERQCPTVG